MAINSYRGTPSTPYAPPYSKYYPVEYFSGVDVSVFIDDGNGEPKYIDEVNSFQFTLTERVVPIYSYASYTASRIQHGARIVQGSFRVNMRPGDYLHELLNGAKNLVNPSTNPNPDLGNFVRPDPVVDPDGFASWQNAQIAQYWTTVEAAATPVATAQDLGASEYFTNGNFLFTLIYGDIDTIDLSRNTGRVRTINNVHIMSVDHPIELSGDNIQESFNFLAVDMNVQNRLNPFT